MMATRNQDGYVRENRQAWDSMAPIHARGSGRAFYRIDEFLAGECKLGPWEPEEVGPVAGKTLIHLQCHIGLDTLSWSRRGARVTGLDFSGAALAEARSFAEELGEEDARFVEGMVEEASALLEGETFDVLYTGRGALCWLPDLTVWARECARLVKPGGILYLEETHPSLDLMTVVEGKEDGTRLFTPHYDPFSQDAVSESSEGTYADPEAKTGMLTMHAWDHGFGEILSCLMAEGFQLELLRERDELFFVSEEGMFEPSRPNYWRLKPGVPRFPLSYTLRMRRGG
ncbi:MAG: class I SAM-dependent methyltransferase [Verrucomicrobiota bacterium]